MATDIVLSGVPVLGVIPTGAAVIIDVHDPAFPTDLTKRTFGKLDPVLLTPRVSAMLSSLVLATLADTLAVAVFAPDNTAYQTTLGALRAYLGTAGGAGSAGAPALALVMPTSVQPGTSYVVTGSYTNDGTAPVLTVSVDAGAFVALPAGSTMSNGAVSLSMPGLASGTHTVQIKDGNGVLSNTVSFAVAAGETLTVTTPAAQTAGTAFNVNGAYTNGPPGGLDYSLDGGTTWATVSGNTLTSASGNYAIIGVNFSTAASAATIRVRDHAMQSIVAVSGAFAVAAAPVETLSVNAIPQQTAGTAFTVTGTFANGSPTQLDYSSDGGTTWTTATGATTTTPANTFSIPNVVVAAASSAQTIKVRDRAAQGIIGTSAAFVVVAAAASALSSPLVFTGAAGAPTGKLALTGSNTSGFTLDGSGGLICGTAGNTHALLVTAGYTPAALSTTTVTPKTAGPMSLGRFDAARQNGGFMFWDGGGNVELHVVTNGVDATLSYKYGSILGTGVQYYAWTGFGIRIDANGGWHPQVNGSDVSIPGGYPAWTPPSVAQGYIEVGSGFQSGTVISQITVG